MEENIIKWLIGISECPKTISLDESRVLSVLKRHRLLGNFAREIKNSRPEWCSDVLFKKVIEEETAILEKHDEQFNFIKSFSKTLSGPIILIKGFSAHFLSNKKLPVRPSNDLDLLSQNPGSLIQQLKNINFTPSKDDFSDHEISELGNGQVVLDIHKHVPIFSYPIDIWDLEKNKVNSQTKSSFSLTGKLTYDDLVLDCIEISENLFIPNIELAVLISCVNIFRDYVCTFDYTPPIKLMEIFEINTLVNHDSFNLNKLLELSIKYKAVHSLEFINEIMSNLFKSNPLVNLPIDKKPGFPQLLLWNFNTWFISSNLNELTAINSLDSIVDKLKPTLISASNDYNKYNLYSNSVEKYGERNTIPINAIEMSSLGRNLSILLKVNWENSLLIQLTLIGKKLFPDDMFYVAFGNYKEVVFGRDLLGGTNTTNNVSFDADNVTFSFELTQDKLDLDKKRIISAVIFAEEKNENSIKSSIFPVKISKEY